MTRLALTAAAAALAATDAAAQAVRVRATEEATGAPMAGAIVDVLDAADRLAAQALLNAAGQRLVALPAAGAYRVRVRRIGFEPHTTAPLAVGRADTVDVPLRIPARRVALQAIRVTGDRRCARDAYGTGPVATLLEEARKALTATALGRGDATLDGRVFVRRLDADGRPQETRVTRPRRTGDRPFSSASAAELSDSGYVRHARDGTMFFGPDEAVLASDAFVRDHCFETVAGRGAEAGLVGVRFSPVPRRRVPDIAGTLWLDSATAELRHLDFWYQDARLPRGAVGPERAGGQVLFDRLPGGAWIVSAWRLRMPRFASSSVRESARPSAWREVGGIATRGADGDTAGDTAGAGAPRATLLPYLEIATPARLSGIVFDSLALRPLSGARVWAAPIPAAEPDPEIDGDLTLLRTAVDTTDAAGRWTLDSLPAGSYRLAFDHPAVAALGVPLPWFDVRLAPGVAVTAELTVPSHAAVGERCALPPPGATAGRGVLFGTVRAAGSDRPVQNALVLLNWADPERVNARDLTVPQVTVRATSGADGAYRVCHVPDGATISAQAYGPGIATGSVDVTLDRERRVRRQDFLLPVSGEGTLARGRAVLAGVVRDSAGRPVADARVTVDGAQTAAGEPAEARTGDDGRFVLAGLPTGTQAAEVTHVGSLPARVTVALRDRDTTHATVVLQRAQALAAVTVTGERSAAFKPSVNVTEAIERRKAGFGFLVMGEELERAPQLRSVLTRIPGVQVYQIPPKGFGPPVPGAGKDAGAGDWVLLMPKGMGTCTLRVFVDRRETNFAEAMSLRPDMLRAVEVFKQASTLPHWAWGMPSVDGADGGCGAVLFWTVMAP